MRAASRPPTKNANLVPGQMAAESSGSGIRSAKSFAAYQDELRRLIRSAWPECTAKFLAAAGDISQRQAERVLARQKSISFELFWSILENEDAGFRFYWALLDSLTSKWSDRERHNREGVLIENMRRELDQRERAWRERKT